MPRSSGADKHSGGLAGTGTYRVTSAAAEAGRPGPRPPQRGGGDWNGAVPQRCRDGPRPRRPTPSLRRRPLGLPGPSTAGTRAPRRRGPHASHPAAAAAKEAARPGCSGRDVAVRGAGRAVQRPRVPGNSLHAPPSFRNRDCPPLLPAATPEPGTLWPQGPDRAHLGMS